jgi:hypothetical protein
MGYDGADTGRLDENVVSHGTLIDHDPTSVYPPSRSSMVADSYNTSSFARSFEYIYDP